MRHDGFYQIYIKRINLCNIVERNHVILNSYRERPHRARCVSCHAIFFIFMIIYLAASVIGLNGNE